VDHVLASLASCRGLTHSSITQPPSFVKLMQNLYHKGVGTYLDRVGIGDPCFLENCDARPTSRPPCEFPTPHGVPGVPPFNVM
jgi:hypothetical protein